MRPISMSWACVVLLAGLLHPAAALALPFRWIGPGWDARLDPDAADCVMEQVSIVHGEDPLLSGPTQSTYRTNIRLTARDSTCGLQFARSFELDVGNRPLRLSGLLGWDVDDPLAARSAAGRVAAYIVPGARSLDELGLYSTLPDGLFVIYGQNSILSFTGGFTPEGRGWEKRVPAPGETFAAGSAAADLILNMPGGVYTVFGGLTVANNPDTDEPIVSDWTFTETVKFVPEAPTAWLLVGGLLAGAALRARRVPALR